MTSRTTCICTLTLSTLLAEHIISSIRINRLTRSRWKFRICTTTNDLNCIVFPHYTFLWHEDGTQWPKHVVSLTKQIQRQLCFDVRIAESEREGTRAETRIGLSAKRTSPFKSAGGGQFRRLLAVEECGSAGKTTGYPLHSHLSPSLPLPCVTVCRLIPIQLYLPPLNLTF